jgi:hypothetical protein
MCENSINIGRVYKKEDLMRYFKALFGLLVKRFFSRRNIILLLILFLLSIYCVQNGIKEYKKGIDTNNEFKSLEIESFSDIKDYNAYSFIGFKILFIPGPTSIFFSNPVFLSELSARINSVTTLDIGSNCKGGRYLRAILPLRHAFPMLSGCWPAC